MMSFLSDTRSPSSKCRKSGRQRPRLSVAYRCLIRNTSELSFSAIPNDAVEAEMLRASESVLVLLLVESGTAEAIAERLLKVDSTITGSATMLCMA